ncbi:adenine nucleotide alpha hydrolases-like protein [Terfezia boudieri ATCC MYA-4762]|uniref:Cytoplasmic tRNA 2-thiolation protein 1 n=1 Tax=Terfezia boudieri ATCC MYA-4762 TaxID=1051890 RepID=A0A3N4LLL1_9PEZI|nr:adenine nucleotide alpha hydrolases-like protein [Terfezia boudieri ATCC MYA-4762]
MTARPQRRPACLQCPSPAKIKRPKNGHALCIAHFLSTFETEVLQTMETSGLFSRGETIAIGASGGKDSTVLASVLSTLNTRHNLGLNLHLLSIDEGIVGYRDHSLATVQRNARQYGLPLTVLSYRELYGWTMDDVVATVGKKSNCTYCGVFRRQALDRGCEMLNISHVVTGHNADDMAETVLMNLLRGDLPRLARCTAITTRSSSSSSSSSDASATVRRSKPLKYAYQKEIVLYAHHRKLDYFTTECTYAPEAFRGSARDLVKALERVRPTAIMDILRSGEAFAGLLRPTDGNRTLVPPQKCAEKECTCNEEDSLGTCSSTSFASGEGAMHIHEAQLRNLHHHHHHHHTTETPSPSSPSPKNPTAKRKQQLLRSCTQCGYLTSQDLCQACVMLQSLNRSRPAVMVQIEHDG